jgi:chromosomal replication initiation ATPase DnaA
MSSILVFIHHAAPSQNRYARQVDGVQFGVNTAELSGPSRRQQICQARALISYLAVRELRISGADVARRMNIDRSSVSRAVGRVEADSALKNMSKALLDHLYPEG